MAEHKETATCTTCNQRIELFGLRGTLESKKQRLTSVKHVNVNSHSITLVRVEGNAQ